MLDTTAERIQKNSIDRNTTAPIMTVSVTGELCNKTVVERSRDKTIPPRYVQRCALRLVAAWCTHKHALHRTDCFSRAVWTASGKAAFHLALVAWAQKHAFEVCGLFGVVAFAVKACIVLHAFNLAHSLRTLLALAFVFKPIYQMIARFAGFRFIKRG